MGVPKPVIGRRGVLAGVGTAGAVVAGAALLPRSVVPEAVTGAVASPPADTAAGYRLTEHVKRYYQTTKI